MVSGHVYIATSLDGFVARRNHALDWLMKQGTAGEDHGYEAFLDTVDGIVMGKGSFMNVLRLGPWPYRKPVVVMSQSLTQDDLPPHLEGKVRLDRSGPLAVMEQLAEAGWSRAYVDGGALVQSFLKDGLIHDIVLTIVPILIGDGISLFGDLGRDLDLELLGAQSYDSGLLQTRYRIVRDGD